MKLKSRVGTDVKHNLSSTLINWLPILHSSISDLENEIKPLVADNPVADVKSGFEENFSDKFPKKIFNSNIRSSKESYIESLTISDVTLFDFLYEQINPPLFPTKISQDIAYEIIENLDENGFYDANSSKISDKLNVNESDIEKIRLRFAYLEPFGIGALDNKEAFLFQLENTNCDDDVYSLATIVINDLDNIYKYKDKECFDKVLKVIKSFKTPPAIDFFEDSKQVIPDIYIMIDDDNNIDVRLNEEHYPIIEIDSKYSLKHEFITKKIKEAKSLIDALEMRKATLYKVGLMIVEYQYDFFMGNDIKPLTLKVLADEFGHNPSTISRAIANKYIACNRGVFAMKDFFTTAIDKDVSNNTIKEFLKELIRGENRVKPYSDTALLEIIQKKFSIKMVRRTISKYRQQLNIASSSERKRLYLFE